MKKRRTWLKRMAVVMSAAIMLTGLTPMGVNAESVLQFHSRSKRTSAPLH